MATTQSKFGRRFDEEFKREVVALASRPGASDTQVARDIGVSPSSAGRWKKPYGRPPAAVAPGVSVGGARTAASAPWRGRARTCVSSARS